MPRTFSGPERTKSKATVVRHVLRAEVLDVDSTWQDLRDLGPDGVDVLVGGQISTTVDELVWRASVRVRLGRGTEGTSPLLEDSLLNRASGLYSPLLTPGALIRVHADTLAPGEAADESTKRLMFVGRIDRCEFASDPLTLTCRDLGGKLLDTIVREDRTYGDKDSPVPAHEVMQQFLDDNADIIGESITLSVPDAPTYVVDNFRQVGVSVLDALNTLAQLFGWVVRYAFDASDDFTLTLYDPQRDRVIPVGGDYLVEPTEYHEVNDAALDLTNVRNRLKGWWRDGVTGEALSLEVPDTGSIAAFGERFEQFGGDLLLPITNGNDMLTFLQFALADLASPPFDHTVKSMFLHFVALGDVPEFASNAVHYDEPQQLAVVGITHDFPDSGQGPATTALQCRGTPSGAYKRWLRFRGGPIFPQIPPAPELMFWLGEESQFGGTTDTVDGAIWIGYRMPRGVDEIRVHVLLGDGAALPVPNVDNSTLALTIRRPEGDIGNPRVGVVNQYPNEPGEYASLALLSTRPRFWKIGLIYAVRGGLTSKQIITPSRQAVDPDVNPEDGVIASVEVVPDGTTNTVTITPDSLDAGGNSWVVLRRNMHCLPPWFVGNSLAPIVFEDTGLNPSSDAKYTYDAFVWNGGKSGPLRRTFADTPVLVAPVFSGGTPLLVNQSGTAKVELSWTGTTAGADGVRVEASLDETAVRTVGTGSLASGTVYDLNTGNKRYRLVALSGSTPLAYSPWKWLDGKNGILSNPAASPQFVGAPHIVFATSFPTLTLALEIKWICATPNAKELRIMRATAGSGGPFSEIYKTAQVASGTYRSQQSDGYHNTEAWFKLEARDALGTVLATSSTVHYDP